MKKLTPKELDQFQLIVESARREGWIASPSEMMVERCGSGVSVSVSASRGSKIMQKTYPSDERWPFELLRDLAWGLFRA